ncbi:MAG TPA: hypothetical protein EYP54_10740 [Anaerolineales bacterium]|nr:hypothetical protein [Anaerolineales bacterium]
MAQGGKIQRQAGLGVILADKVRRMGEPVAAVAAETEYLAEQAVPPIAELAGRINLLLLGSDQRPGHWDFRTDTIVFVSFDPQTGETLLASFPRDLYVRIPGYGVNRINTAMEFGGFPALAETLAFNFGLRPQHYILVNFHGFKALIETLGGIDVYVPRRLCDHLRCVGPGWVHMDADVALWYARSRETTSDFDRARRQQEVLRAIASRLLRLDALHRAPELYALFRGMVVTDLGVDDVVRIVAQAGRFSPDRTHGVVFAPPQFGVPWITPQGAYVVLPNIGAIQAQIRTMLR